MAQNNQQCPVCSGRRVVENSQHVPYVCPLCQGSGRAEPNYIRLRKDYTFGNSSTIVLAAGAPGTAQQQSLTVSGRYDFETVFGVASQSGTFEDQLFDESSRAWQDPGIFIKNVNRWGTAQLPFRYLAPFVIASQAQLQGNFRDTANAGNNTVQAVLSGYELVPEGEVINDL